VVPMCQRGADTEMSANGLPDKVFAANVNVTRKTCQDVVVEGEPSFIY